MTSNAAAFRLRLAAVGLAVILNLTAALAALVLAAALPRSWSDARFWLLMASAAWAIGAFIGACIAWDTASGVASSRQSLRRTVVCISARALVSGAVATGLIGALASTPNYLRFDSTVTLGQIGSDIVGPIATVIALAGYVAVLGLLIFGLPAAIVVTPIVTIWAWVVRQLGRRTVSEVP